MRRNQDDGAALDECCKRRCLAFDDDMVCQGRLAVAGQQPRWGDAAQQRGQPARHDTRRKRVDPPIEVATDLVGIASDYVLHQRGCVRA